jgi:hypothetical protein
METLIREINRAAELAAVEAYKFMEEQKIKKALAPVQFEEFKKACEAECKNIGAVSPVKLHFGEESPHEFSVTNLRSGKIVSFRYDPDVPCIHFNAPDSKGHIAFHVSPQGTMLQFVESGIPKFVPQLIQKIFKTIVR